MREIKFRAWDTHNKRMVNWFDVMFINFNKQGLNTTQTMLCEYPLRRVSSESNFFNYMQYTGLNDKDGKEIYEGDIVKFSEHFCGDSTFPEDVEIIEYELNGFNDSLQIGYMDKPDWCEIIGNIYENPELLDK